MRPPEPTPEQCEKKETIVWNGRTGFACWYPQMGGYVGRCVVELEENGCFNAYVWHDGEFPFSDDGERQPAKIHHCVPEQFIEFGTLVSQKLEATFPNG